MVREMILPQIKIVNSAKLVPFFKMTEKKLIDNYKHIINSKMLQLIIDANDQTLNILKTLNINYFFGNDLLDVFKNLIENRENEKSIRFKENDNYNYYYFKSNESPYKHLCQEYKIDNHYKKWCVFVNNNSSYSKNWYIFFNKNYGNGEEGLINFLNDNNEKNQTYDYGFIIGVNENRKINIACGCFNDGNTKLLNSLPTIIKKYDFFDDIENNNNNNLASFLGSSFFYDLDNFKAGDIDWKFEKFINYDNFFKLGDKKFYNTYDISAKNYIINYGDLLNDLTQKKINYLSYDDTFLFVIKNFLKEKNIYFEEHNCQIILFDKCEELDIFLKNMERSNLIHYDFEKKPIIIKKEEGDFSDELFNFIKDNIKNNNDLTLERKKIIEECNLIIKSIDSLKLKNDNIKAIAINKIEEEIRVNNYNLEYYNKKNEDLKIIFDNINYIKYEIVYKKITNKTININLNLVSNKCDLSSLRSLLVDFFKNKNYKINFIRNR